MEKAQLFQNKSLISSSLSGAASTSRTNYDNLRKPLKLIYEEINETEPDDVAYVYSGYAPLSIRLVQCVIQKQVMTQAVRGAGAGGAGLSTATGWRGFEDVVRNVGGKTIDETQTGEDKAVRAKGKDYSKQTKEYD